MTGFDDCLNEVVAAVGNDEGVILVRAFCYLYAYLSR